jgi:hypothetical protein
MNDVAVTRLAMDEEIEQKVRPVVDLYDVQLRRQQAFVDRSGSSRQRSSRRMPSTKWRAPGSRVTSILWRSSMSFIGSGAGFLRQ